jgi:ABC-type multidrug transport system ATPase subunit
MIEALLVADRIGVMHKGDLLMLGTPKRFFADHKSLYYLICAGCNSANQKNFLNNI